MTRELISPATAQALIWALSAVFTLLFAFLGWRRFGTRGLLWGAIGPMVASAWLGHSALQERLGADSLALFAGEVIVVSLGGALAAWLWERPQVGVK